MPNANDPFEMDDGFENIPVVQAPAQAVNKVATSAVKHTAAQAKALTKSFISQLYGKTTTSTTDDDQQQDAAVDPMAVAQKMQAKPQGAAQAAAAAHQAGSTSKTQQQTASTPEEEERLQRARQELAQTHRSEYVIPTFGDITSLESDIRKEAQKRQQQDEQRKQEEEQKEEKKLAELEQKKKQDDVAVTQARTKSERRPGAG